MSESERSRAVRWPWRWLRRILFERLPLARKLPLSFWQTDTTTVTKFLRRSYINKGAQHDSAHRRQILQGRVPVWVGNVTTFYRGDLGVDVARLWFAGTEPTPRPGKNPPRATRTAPPT